MDLYKEVTYTAPLWWWILIWTSIFLGALSFGIEIGIAMYKKIQRRYGR